MDRPSTIIPVWEGEDNDGYSEYFESISDATFHFNVNKQFVSRANPVTVVVPTTAGGIAAAAEVEKALSLFKSALLRSLSTSRRTFITNATRASPRDAEPMALVTLIEAAYGTPDEHQIAGFNKVLLTPIAPGDTIRTLVARQGCAHADLSRAGTDYPDAIKYAHLCSALAPWKDATEHIRAHQTSVDQAVAAAAMGHQFDARAEELAARAEARADELAAIFDAKIAALAAAADPPAAKAAKPKAPGLKAPVGRTTEPSQPQAPQERHAELITYLLKVMGNRAYQSEARGHPLAPSGRDQVFALTQDKGPTVRFVAADVRQHPPAVANEPCTRHGKQVAHTHAECGWLKRALELKSGKGGPKAHK